jgi:hypothetical protein
MNHFIFFYFNSPSRVSKVCLYQILRLICFQAELISFIFPLLFNLNISPSFFLFCFFSLLKYFAAANLVPAWQSFAATCFF